MSNAAPRADMELAWQTRTDCENETRIVPAGNPDRGSALRCCVYRAGRIVTEIVTEAVPKVMRASPSRAVPETSSPLAILWMFAVVGAGLCQRREFVVERSEKRRVLELNRLERAARLAMHA